MSQRVAYGFMALVGLLGVVMLDVGIARTLGGMAGALPDLFRRGSALPVLVVVLCLRGAAELNELLRESGAKPHARFAYLMISVLILSPWLSAAGWLGDNAAHVEGLFWQVVWLILATLGTGILTVLRRETVGASRDSATTLMVILYLGFAPSFAMQLRSCRGFAGQDGAWLLFFTILLTKVSDIGAYFAGSLWGRHKLIPAISPGKSIEGTIGGLVASALVAVGLASITLPSSSSVAEGTQETLSNSVVSGLVALLTEMTLAFQANLREGSSSVILRSAVLGVCLSGAGQFGDLFESCFKRDAGAKDSAKLIPRFGGILDLIDSPLFAVPVAWVLLTAVWGVL